MVRSSFVASAALIVVVLASSFAAGCASDDRTRTATCTPACSGFQMCCTTATGSTACANTGVDTNNCGSCGSRCAAGERCTSGVCMRSGDGGTVPPTDGSRPPPPDSGPTGMCTPTCSSTQRCCGTTCMARTVAPGTDGRTDPSFMNCNGCGIACDAMRANACTTPIGMAGATPGCRCGNFPSCTSGAVCAMGATGTMQCVNLQTDLHNCGMIGHECASGESCVMGMCGCGATGAACGTGQGCCGGSCVDTTMDEANCGMCGRMCPGGTTCNMGRCLCGTAECTPASGDSLGQLCCSGACVAQDNSNCGSCGAMCDSGGGTSCINGTSITGGGMAICCGIALIPGMPGFCLDIGGGDGGLPIP